MSESIMVAVVTGLFAVAAEVVIAIVNSKAMIAKLEKQSELDDARLEKAQAVTDTKIEELTREVRKHNGFAEKIPVLEEKISAIDRRVVAVEQKGKAG